MAGKIVRIILVMMARSAVGILAGLFAGVAGGVIAGLLIGIVIGDYRAILMVIALVGGGIGSPIVGVVVTLLMGLTSYRSHIGIEWGVVGVASALFLAWPLRFSLATLIVFSVMYAVAAIAAYRVVVALFEDEPQTNRLTFKTAAVYGVASLVISGVIYSVFLAIEPIID